MAQDIDRLIVQMSAEINAFKKEMAKVNGITAKVFSDMEKKAREADKNLDRILTHGAKKLGSNIQNNLKTPLAGLAGLLGTRELIKFADGWTQMGNLVAASSRATGVEARSLSDLRKEADDARSAIEPYVELYARIMRSASGVAKSEEEIAQATNIVSKAFVAGGAAASEQAAGVLQLGQALGSGFLQGDELRSIRENAPLLAEAIADEFGTTIAGLKELGAEGKLTSERVFRGILNAQKNIEAQFNVTNATMENGITRIKNAMLEYVGAGAQASGVAQSITAGLNIMADNFDKVADAALQVAGVIAGVLVGRSLTGMIRTLGLVGATLTKFISLLKGVKSLAGVATAFGTLGAAAGPLATIVGGGLALAVGVYAKSAIEARTRSENLHAEWERLAQTAGKTKDGVDDISNSLKEMTSRSYVKKIQEIREELDKLRHGASLPFFDNGKNLDSLQGRLRAEISRGMPEEYVKRRLAEGSTRGSIVDQNAYLQVQKLLGEFDKGRISVEKLAIRLKEINNTNISGGVIKFNNEILAALNNLDNGQSVLKSTEFEEIGRYLTDVENLKSSLGDLSQKNLVSGDQKNQINDLITQFQTGRISAENLAASLDQLSRINPDLRLWVEAANQVAAAFGQLKNEIDLNQVISAIGNNVSRATQAIKDAWEENRKNAEKATKEWAEYNKEQDRKNSLTQKAIDLEKQVAETRKEFGDGAKYIPDSEIIKSAQAALDAEARRKTAGRTSEDNEYDRLTKQIGERVEMIRAETEVQSKLNPFVNDYGYVIEKVRTYQQLLNAAKSAGIKLDADTMHTIGQLADKMAEATAESARLADEQEKLRQKLEDIKDVSHDVTRTFIDSMINGKSATEALGDAISRLGQRLLDAGLDTLFDNIFKSAGQNGNWLAGIGKAFGFAGGGYTGAGGKNQPAGVVHKGEVVWSKDDVKRWGGAAAVDAMRRGYAEGGIVGAPVVPEMPHFPSAAELRAMADRSRERRIQVDVTPSPYF